MSAALTPWLYFECHDIGDFDLATRFIASDTFLAGTLRKVGQETRPEEGEGRTEDEGQDGSWVFSEMTAGKATPLAVDHYYFP
jgi:hypothetical protein